MSWTGDWMCVACQHMNFKKRDSCQRCDCSKYAGDQTHANINRTEVLAGDWYYQVMNCGAHNYASRTSCYRCSAQKPECTSGYNGGNIELPSGGYQGAIPGWKTGDWICTRQGCGQHNYACRSECFKCKTQRDFGEKSYCFSSS